MNEFKRGDYVHCPHHGYYGIVTRPFDMLITWEDGEIGHHREDDLALVCRPYRHGKRADDSAELGADE